LRRTSLITSASFCCWDSKGISTNWILIYNLNAWSLYNLDKMESTAIVTFRHRLIMDVYMPANRGIIMLVTILRSVTCMQALGSLVWQVIC
jgi:hypothetical protein